MTPRYSAGMSWINCPAGTHATDPDELPPKWRDARLLELDRLIDIGWGHVMGEDIDKWALDHGRDPEMGDAPPYTEREANRFTHVGEVHRDWTEFKRNNSATALSFSEAPVLGGSPRLITQREQVRRAFIAGCTSSVEVQLFTGLPLKICAAHISKLKNTGFLKPVCRCESHMRGGRAIIWSLASAQ